MKRLFFFLTSFMLLVTVCFSQTNRMAEIRYKYCFSPDVIKLEGGIEAHIENFNENDLTKMIVVIDNINKSTALVKNIYLTAGAPYLKGTRIETEETGRSESYIKLQPLNINSYWQDLRIILFINVEYDIRNVKSGFITINRANSNNQEEIKKLAALCPKPVPPAKAIIIPRWQIIANQMNIKMIYPNDDARMLIEAFNPDLMKKDSASSTTPVLMPAFPPITSKQSKAAQKQYKENRKPDQVISEQFNQSADLLSARVVAIGRTRLPDENVEIEKIKTKLRELNYYCLNIKPYSKKIGRTTMNFLRQETDALNNILKNSDRSSGLTRKQIDECNLLMDNIYLNVRKIAVRYRVPAWTISKEGGFSMQKKDNTFYASTGTELLPNIPDKITSFPTTEPSGIEVCLKLSWWERIFKPKLERKFFVYVFKCPDNACIGQTCSNAKGCFNGCSQSYYIKATCLGADAVFFHDMASVAWNTLTDAKWTINIYEDIGFTKLLQSDVIYTSSATCDITSKKLQLWLKLKP